MNQRGIRQRGIRQRKVWAGPRNNGIDLYGMGDHFAPVVDLR